MPEPLRGEKRVGESKEQERDEEKGVAHRLPAASAADGAALVRGPPVILEEDDDAARDAGHGLLMRVRRIALQSVHHARLRGPEGDPVPAGIL
jgi:hypothetical protein